VNRILVNTAIDHYRQRQSKPLVVDIVHAQLVETSENIIQQISVKELLILVQQLTPSYRMVFNLFVVEGFSHKEISQKLGISIGTSKSNLAKARNKLKAMIYKRDHKKTKYG